MPEDDIQTVDIKIFGREFKIRCPSGEVAALEEATRYVDDKMRSMREKEKIASNDVLAIITALNLAHDLIKYEKHQILNQQIALRLSNLKSNISNALLKKKLPTIGKSDQTN